MAWTDERIEELKRLWEQGLTASQIAEKLGQGITRNAVIGKAHRLDLKARPSPVKTSEAVAAVETRPAVAPASAPQASPVAASTPAPPPARKAATSRPTPTSSKTTLLDLSDKVCKWPIGHPGEPDFHFCGKPSQPGFPYCGEHCAVAYQAQLPRRDRGGRPLPPTMPGIRPR